MTDTDTLWGEVKSEISRQIKKPAFETWFAPSSGKVTEDCTFIVEAPNEFAKEWMETRYKDMIRDTVNKLSGEEYKLIITAAETPTSAVTIQMDRQQALGYMLLACRDMGLSSEQVKQLYSSMKGQFDIKTAVEAEVEGVDWFRSITEVTGNN